MWDKLCSWCRPLPRLYDSCLISEPVRALTPAQQAWVRISIKQHGLLFFLSLNLCLNDPTESLKVGVEKRGGPLVGPGQKGFTITLSIICANIWGTYHCPPSKFEEISESLGSFPKATLSVTGWEEPESQFVVTSHPQTFPPQWQGRMNTPKSLPSSSLLFHLLSSYGFCISTTCLCRTESRRKDSFLKSSNKMTLQRWTMLPLRMPVANWQEWGEGVPQGVKPVSATELVLVTEPKNGLKN